MNKFKIVIYGAIFIMVPFLSKAQVVDDALMVSDNDLTGSARFQGIAGAGAVLGGDISSSLLNPAGIGFYNRSEFSITPGLQFVKTTSNFLGGSFDDSKANFYIGSLGLVINNSEDDYQNQKWKGGSFLISYQRINNYHINTNYGPRDNPDFSVIDNFASAADGIPIGEIRNNTRNNDYVGLPEVAYDSYLINPDESGKTYIPMVPIGTIASQEGKIRETGKQTQWNFSYGGNYDDRIYFGLGLGIRSVSYQAEKYHQENLRNPNGLFVQVGQLSVEGVEYVDVTDNFSMEGTGINANFGLIYRPMTNLTFGASINTPTLYNLENSGYTDVYSEIRGVQTSDTTSQFNFKETVGTNRFQSNYNLTTPTKIMGGLSYFFEKQGFITVDVEYLNYAKNSFSTNENYSLGDLNEEVKGFFKPVVNIRVGGEYRYNIFRLRGGFAMEDDPVSSGNNIDRSKNIYTGGLGIRLPDYFMDLAVINTSHEASYIPYFGAPVNEQTKNQTRIVFTLGFNF